MIKIRNISLNRISSIASIICLLDCIIIPIVMFTLSVFNIFNSKLAHLHEISDILALYIMTPICSLCILFNFIQLNNVLLLTWGIFSVILFVISHGHFNIGPKCNELLEKYHVFISILSIILLLSNNYTSQKMIKKRNLDHCCSIKRFGKNANNSSFTNHHSSEHACNEDHHDHHDHHNRTISASSNNGNKYYMNYDKNERELVSFL
ncbi:hypothetical protein PFUGPA_04417 [Plasmodium falciparum Palo Alto/Uganda]|uniref:MerC domain-containing protein n=1 Tax=Plasmodium falciparum (isolate Palo Alto / Uganda) TaxID=57270 RepID=W4IVK7_PLAFP|nr:hypothetical protein PFUGPA_04417 [Plasmodium falciparum Palo Alto/Uganda]